MIFQPSQQTSLSPTLRWREWWPYLSIVLLASLASFLWAYSFAAGATFTLAIVAGAAATLLPGLVLTILLCGAWLPARIAPAGVELSIADAVFLAGLLLSLGAALRLPHRARQIVAVTLFYLGLLLFPVVAHPTSAAVIEWFHRGFLLTGSVLIGCAIVLRLRTVPALRAFVAAGLIVSVSTMAQWFLSGTGNSPTVGFGLPKNYAGGLLGMAFLLVLATPQVVSHHRWRTIVGACLLLGILATQSRGSLLAIGPSVAYLLIRKRRPKLRSLVALGGGLTIAMTWVLYSLGQQTRDPTLSSVGTRLDFIRTALEYWREGPVVGQGLRYYLDPAFQFPYPAGDPEARPSPHNIIVELLSESGILGALAFGLLILATAVILHRASNDLAAAAVAAQLSLFFHSLVDIYWLAGLTSVAWVIAGMGASVVSAGRPARDGRLAVTQDQTS